MAQGFHLLGQGFDFFFPRGTFRLTFLAIQNFALAGKLLDLDFCIFLVGQQFIHSFNMVFP